MNSLTGNSKHPAIIATPRLLLKAVTPALINELITTLSRAEFLDYFGLADTEYEHYLSMHAMGMETHRISLYFFLLIKKDDQTVLGDCGFHTWNATHRRAELFYNLRRTEFRNQGYMKEALKAIIRHGFTELHLNRIQALVAAENEASIRLLKGNGFTFEGTMREDYIVDGIPDDSDCYSLLLKDWLEKK